MQKGVTLIELIVVLSIVVILTAIAISKYSDFSSRALRDRALPHIVSLAEASKLYKLEEGSYEGTTMELFTFLGGGELGKYGATFDFIGLSNFGTARCVFGNVKGLTPPYTLQYCFDEDSTQPITKGGDQPFCKGDRNGNGTVSDDTFLPCRQGFP